MPARPAMLPCVGASVAREVATVMSYYSHHVFFCTNRREDGSQCCAQCGSQEMRGYLKQRTKALGIAGAGRVRINTAGCLDR